MIKWWEWRGRWWERASRGRSRAGRGLTTVACAGVRREREGWVGAERARGTRAHATTAATAQAGQGKASRPTAGPPQGPSRGAHLRERGALAARGWAPQIFGRVSKCHVGSCCGRGAPGEARVWTIFFLGGPPAAGARRSGFE